MDGFSSFILTLLSFSYKHHHSHPPPHHHPIPVTSVSCMGGTKLARLRQPPVHRRNLRGNTCGNRNASSTGADGWFSDNLQQRNLEQDTKMLSGEVIG